MYRGGLTLSWWGLPHCGPFNSVAEMMSEGLDEVCRQHDMHYALLIELYGKLKTYFYYNEADRCFVKNAANITGPASWFTTNVWKVKERFLPRLDESANQILMNCEYSKDTNVTKEQQRSTVLYQVKTQRETKVAEAGKMAPETLMTVKQFNRDGDNSGNSENVYDLLKFKGLSVQRHMTYECSKDTNVTKEQQRSTAIYQVKTQRETKVAEARKMEPETLMAVKQVNGDGDDSGGSRNLCGYRYINCFSALSCCYLDLSTILLYLILIFIVLMCIGVLFYLIRRVRMQ